MSFIQLLIQNHHHIILNFTHLILDLRHLRVFQSAPNFVSVFISISYFVLQCFIFISPYFIKVISLSRLIISFWSLIHPSLSILLPFRQFQSLSLPQPK